MSEEDTKIEKPLSAKKPISMDDFVVHVMPKEFLGRSGEVKKGVEPVKKEPVKIAPPPKPIVPVKKKPVEKKSKMPLLIFIIVMTLIVGGSIAVLFIFQSEEEPVLEPVPVVTPDPIPEPEPTGPEPGVDTDSDGLTDIEERLYGTDHRNPDTDNDSFLDGNEVFHRFDPLSPESATLLDTGSVEVYEYVNGSSFNVHYPASWKTTEGESVGGDKQFTVESPGATSMVLTWALVEGERPTEGGVPKVTKEGYQFFELDDDGRKVMLVIDRGEGDELRTYTYIFEYDLGASPTIEYLQTFQMMINSFKITE